LPRIIEILRAAGFVIAGATLAPRRRIATAAVLAILWVFYSLNVYLLVHHFRGAMHYLSFATAVVAAAGAAAAVFYWEQSKRRNPIHGAVEEE
jgi:hypothetical protein